MPHIVVEYSANLETRIAVEELVQRVHAAALATGVFEVAAVRTRAERREIYVIADGHQDNSFVAIQVRIAPGRDPQTRKRLGQAIFDAACKHLATIPEARSLAVSLEVQEIDTVAVFRKNDLHRLLHERQTESSRINGVTP